MVSPSAPDGKLTALSDRFNALERQVQGQQEPRNGETADVMAGVARIEYLIGTEIHRRADSQKAMQMTVETQVADAQGSLESLFLERYDHMHSILEAMGDRVCTVEKDFSASRELYVRDMEEKSGAIDQDMSSLRSSFQQEAAERAESEKHLHQMVQALEAKTAEKLYHERNMFEHKFGRLHSDFEESKRVREEQRARYEAEVAAELSRVQGAIANARKAREQADDDIVNALNHYTRSLQEALRSASTRVMLAHDGAASGASGAPIVRLRG